MNLSSSNIVASMRTATVWVRNDQELLNDADGQRQQSADELGVYLRATCNADDLEESVAHAVFVSFLAES